MGYIGSALANIKRKLWKFKIIDDTTSLKFTTARIFPENFIDIQLFKYEDIYRGRFKWFDL